MFTLCGMGAMNQITIKPHEHHSLVWQLGGSTYLGIRAAGSKSVLIDSSGQLLDLLGYIMQQSPDTAFSFALSFSLGNKNYRFQIQCQSLY